MLCIAQKAGPWLHHLALTIPFRVHRLHDLHGPSAINAASEEWPGSGRSESVTVGRPGAKWIHMCPSDQRHTMQSMHYRIFKVPSGRVQRAEMPSVRLIHSSAQFWFFPLLFFPSLLSKTWAANPLHKAGSVSFKQCRDSQAGNSRQPGSPTLRHPNHPVCCPQPGEMKWNESPKKWVRPDMG